MQLQSSAFDAKGAGERVEREGSWRCDECRGSFGSDSSGRPSEQDKVAAGGRDTRRERQRRDPERPDADPVVGPV
ncbi:hypothetical protein CRG98_024616 [Punica granatum]|uniref:Uncharacterized protein n=1 Tax=Punica granatum TaxID=22663 RepID=A0A2I0JHB4_PUNGR|nr:hypothetical protein CRG98_024616 [Punica granatum]